MKWSKNTQTASYLAATRQAFLNKEFAKIIANHCGVFDGSRVLEVGCGIGCFTKYLSKEVNRVEFIGLDKELDFINNGERVHGNNRVSYIKGSAYELPFDDNSFDAVYSYTFFNCIEFPDLAMKEMKRVVKQNSPITSITSMSLNYEAKYEGNYPSECTWRNDIINLEKDFVLALEKFKIGPISLSHGYSASYMPTFFSDSMLNNINIFPLSWAFSLSDARMDKNEKVQYIQNIYIGELERLQSAMENKEFVWIFSEEKYTKYKNALKEKRDFWLNNLDDNKIWDWFGASSLLVSGVK